MIKWRVIGEHIYSVKLENKCFDTIQDAKAYARKLISCGAYSDVWVSKEIIKPKYYEVIAFNHEDIITSRTVSTAKEANKTARGWLAYNNCNMVRIITDEAILYATYVMNYGQAVVIDADGNMKNIRI